MSEQPAKPYDCVEAMREIREKLGREIEGMSHKELTAWLRSHEYADPTLKRLAELVKTSDERS